MSAPQAMPLAMGLLILLVAVVAASMLRLQQGARRRAEAHADGLSADLQRLGQALANTRDAVVVTDAEGVITWVNAGFETITGYTLREALGRRPGPMLQCERSDPQAIDTMRSALREQRACQVELINRHRDGRDYWIEIRLMPIIAADGTLQGFMALQSDVTRRKQGEASLRAARAFLDKVGRIGGVGGWSIEARGDRVTLTDQTTRLLGLELGDDLSVDAFLACFDPQARPPLQRMLHGGADARRPLDLEVGLRTIDGRDVWVHLGAEAEFDDHGPLRVVGALQDITVRRALKIELRRSAQLMRSAIDAIDEAFAVYDPDDRLVYCNDKYRAVYDLSADMIRPGARFEDIIRRGAERGQYQAAAGRMDEWVEQRLAAHRAGDRTLVQRLSNGRILRVIDRRTPDGHMVGFRVDITDLVRATEVAERADRVKGEFIATISHELRTPLQSVLGFADLGRHFAQPHPQLQSMFEDVHAAGTRMLALVNDLLDVSRIDGSVGSLVLKQGDLGSLTAGVVHELGPQAAARRLDVRLCLPSRPVAALVDAFRLQQVVRNVLANAIRFAPEGSCIELQLHDADPEGPALTVLDHGPGVPPDELDAIFEPFVQSSRTRDGSGGTGLGLAICRRIMGAHGGSIQASLPPEGGLCMHVRLPPLPEAPPDALNAPRRVLGGRRAREAQPTLHDTPL